MMTFKDKLKRIFHLCREGKYNTAFRLVYQRFLREIFRIIPHDGVKVVEEDWGYLIVLSACRYDTFRKLNTIPGRLEKRISLGSCAREWCIKNFDGYYDDIVYVSANPRISHIKFETEFGSFRGADHFFKVVYVGDHGWDKELGTVPPEIVTKTALRVKEKYPDKRMIIHYLQPHAPWIGETKLTGKDLGLSFNSATEWFLNSSKIGHWGEFGKAVEMVGLKFLRKAYEDNLKLVLKEVNKLVENLEGKIVVTSNHGECFGEKFIIEHPAGIYIKELVEVPWLIVER